MVSLLLERQMFRRVRGFSSSRKGNFAVLTALVATTLCVAFGSGIDLTRMYELKRKMQDVADAGALAGARYLSKNPSGSPDQAVKLFIDANLPPGAAPPSVNIDYNKTTRAVTVTTTATIDTSFLKLARINEVSVAASSSVTLSQESHTDIYFLLDVSESMNLASSDADRTELEKWTLKERGLKCAFACHDGGAGLLSLEGVARKHNIRLRIDDLRSAADAMIDKVLAGNAAGNGLTSNRISVAGFSVNFQKGVTQSKDAAALKASIRNFNVANDHTRYAWALSQFTAMVGDQGTGLSPDSPRKIAIFVTDGVKDEGFGLGQLGPLDPALCAGLKNKGIDLAVLEIKYVPRDGEFYYDIRVKSYYPKISSGLRSCASKDMHFLATDSAQAASAMVTLIDSVMGSNKTVITR